MITVLRGCWDVSLLNSLLPASFSLPCSRAAHMNLPPARTYLRCKCEGCNHLPSADMCLPCNCAECSHLPPADMRLPCNCAEGNHWPVVMTCAWSATVQGAKTACSQPMPALWLCRAPNLPPAIMCLALECVGCSHLMCVCPAIMQVTGSSFLASFVGEWNGKVSLTLQDRSGDLPSTSSAAGTGPQLLQVVLSLMAMFSGFRCCRACIAVTD